MSWIPGEFAPAPGPAGRREMLAAQTRAELTMLLRNGEQVLLTLVIPLGLLVTLTEVPVVTVHGTDRAGFFVPGILALAVMSSAFTGQAIAVGFERQYGVLERLGTTPLPRAVLLGAKTLAVLATVALQAVLVAGTGLLVGWRPHGSPFAAAGLVVLGTAAFAGLGLLLGGTLRGLTSLAAANAVWFVMLLLGGVVFPLTAFGPARHVLAWLPTAALAAGLRGALGHPGGVPAGSWLALAGCAAGSLALAARFFRWSG